MFSVVFQHTPVVNIEYSVLRLEVHDILAEPEKLFSLKRLCEVVRDHVVGWTVFNFKLAILDPISDKIVPYVYMSGSLGAILLPVVLEEDV